MGEAVGKDLVSDAVYGRPLGRHPREKGKVTFHAVRGGDTPSSHTVFFFGEGERLEITHHCLNWKGELEGLIKRGVDIWDLCISDAYNHSRPLAGYVGAHMIYRAIYNELPSKPMRYTIKQTYVDGILERYAYVADAQIIKEDDITYLD
jgi:hypothetical protein